MMDRDNALDYPMLYEKALAEVERLQRQTKLLRENNRDVAKDLFAEIERLKAALEDIATGICSESGAASIARDALAGKTQEEWS